MEKRATIDFTRDPGTLSLPGFRARSQETLRQQIENAGLPGTWVAADLSLGAWRGQQVAREFFAQLALELPSSEFAVADWHRAAPPREISYADIIGEFIDAEALGDRATVESLNFAQRIRERVQGVAPYLFLVIAPRAALPWENENLLFIRFLAQALRATPSKIALVAADADDPAVPADWEIDWQGSREPPPVTVAGDILGLVPGVSSPEMRLALAAADLPPAAALIPLANGYCLVPPERRRRPQDVARLEFDRLGALARPFGWLDAYAQFHGNNMYVEPWFLYTEGQRRLAEGGLGITLRLLERALTKLRIGLDWGIFQSYAQGLRVASQRFAEAANIPDPPAVLPPEMRSFLLQSKGWGYVMTGNLACAEACFQQACSFADPAGQERREYLYLLNIFALCRLKAGDITQALALEKEIEERTARLPFPDRRLQYVNSINLARLYRRRQEFEQAEQYFNAAFSTTLGARSESDALYANLILARLAAERGNHREAFSAWMRAGLHWAASNAPEAVGARVVSSLLGKSAKFEGSMPEAVSASIAASLLAAAALSGSAEIARALQNAKPATLPAPVFARTEQLRQVLPAAGFHCALLGPGFAVLGMHNPLTPQIAGQNFRQLRALLFTVLATLAPAGFFAATQTIGVEDLFGQEIPATPEELLAVCVRLNVPHFAIKGAAGTLSAQTRAQFEQQLQVSLGCAVESLAFQNEQAVILFKRYLAPLRLAPEESRLLFALLEEDDPTVGYLLRRYAGTESGENVLRLLRRLEQKRVVNLDFPRTFEFNPIPLR